jgi:UDP-N-acetylglucosamine 2-epimerase
MQIAHIVGARPHFPKLAPVSRAVRAGGHSEIIIHTGQHFDVRMSDVFFEELDLPPPQYHLGVGSGSHGVQTGRMLERLDPVLGKERPDVILVYGDTNSTLAGALAGAKLGLTVGHVEAGLRSFVWSMPEEVNRVLADRCSQVLFCPTQTAVANLAAEGITAGVHLVGDVMYDALLQSAPLAEKRSRALERFGLVPRRYLLATIHRAGNTDDSGRLASIAEALNRVEEPVIFPVHPRTAQRIAEAGIVFAPHVQLVEPLSYLDMLQLERNARRIITDSGGVQKEAYLLRTPCITLRDETEWPETLAGGWNVLVGTHPESVCAALAQPEPVAPPEPLFGDGRAAERIVAVLEATAGPGG